MAELRKCSRCQSTKAINYFSLNIKMEYYKTCDPCRARNKIHGDDYRNRPLVKQRRKAQQAEYHNRPEIKVRRIEYERERRQNVTYIAQTKIYDCNKSDRKHNREYDDNDYITVDWIINELARCENKCFHCKKQLKLTEFDYKDNDQFSVDRIFNDLAHEPENCVISCWGCNDAHGNNDIF